MQIMGENKKKQFQSRHRIWLAFPFSIVFESRKTKIHYLLKKKKLFLTVLLDHDKTFKRYFHVFSYYLYTVLENTAFRLIMKLLFQRACSIISSEMLDSTNQRKKYTTTYPIQLTWAFRTRSIKKRKPTLLYPFWIGWPKKIYK